MPRTMRTRSGTVAWNSSSRGNVSSACTSALWSWLAGIQPEVVDDALHLVAQDRDLVGAPAVGRRGPQSEEPAFAADIALRVEGLDADIVEVGRAVHRGDRVRLGDDERLRGTRESPDLAGKRDRLRLAPGARTHDAEARARHRHEPVLARPAPQPVLAVAEEREVVVLHPLEQRLRLADLAAVAARSCAAECGGRVRGLGAHPAPVAGCRAHVLERAADGGLDRGEAGRVRLAVDLDHLPGLELRARRRVVEVDRLQPAAPVADHGEDRVREQVDGETRLRAHHAERVDQERLVVRDDHDDRVRRGEAVAFRVRVEDPHQRTAAAPRESEFELRRARRRRGPRGCAARGRARTRRGRSSARAGPARPAGPCGACGARGRRCGR